MSKTLAYLVSKDGNRRIIPSLRKIRATTMKTRKLSIGLIMVMLLFTTLYLKGEEEKNKRSRINFILHSGVSFITYNTTATFKPAANIGCGLSYRLSKIMSLVFYFKHYLFYPKYKYSWFLYWGDSPIPVKLEEPFYMGDLTYEFYDFLLEVKLKHKPLTNRLNFYSIAGAGVSYRREASEWSVGIYGRKIYYAESIFWLVSAGLGLEYDVNRNIDIFLEASYNYCFLKMRDKNTGVFPVKIGLAWKF